MGIGFSFVSDICTVHEGDKGFLQGLGRGGQVFRRGHSNVTLLIILCNIKKKNNKQIKNFCNYSHRSVCYALTAIRVLLQVCKCLGTYPFKKCSKRCSCPSLHTTASLTAYTNQQQNIYTMNKRWQNKATAHCIEAYFGKAVKCSNPKFSQI